MNGAEEGENLVRRPVSIDQGLWAVMETHDGAVADLDRLDDMQQQFRRIAGHQEAAAGHRRMIDIPRQEDG